MKYLFSTLIIALNLITFQGASAKDFFEDDSFVEEAQTFYDPLESFNRKSFSMLKFGNNWVLIPLAKGYDFLTPHFIQPHIFSVFQNLNQPLNIANSIFLPHKAVSIKQTSHFLTNTLLGFGGFFDIHSAYVQPTPSLSLEDIAQYYFEKPLPYLVLPMGFGNVFSIASWFERQQMLTVVRSQESLQNAMIGYTVGGIVVGINQNKEQIEDTLNNSIDAYSILRNVYYQSQLGKLQSLKIQEKPRAYTSLISHEFI